jgi:AcrR family transcriptional regulator
VSRLRQIDRAGVLQAALVVADECGLDGLTMHRVAERLAVTPMALYRHVANKADLLDGLVEQLLDEITSSDTTTEADQLMAAGQAVRTVARRHPTVFPLLLQRPASTPAALRARDRVYEALRNHGIAEKDVARVERLVSTTILGFAASEVSGRFEAHSRKEMDADFSALTAMIRAGLSEYTTH